MASIERGDLRARAVAHSLFAPTTLARAVATLGFVQADPIRAPARAQDLILRHRVARYRAGDLERAYASLDLEEDVTLVYGFLPRATWRLLHPRRSQRESLPVEAAVLALVRAGGPVHPREVAARLGDERVTNDWGGRSRATTRALHHLHELGLVRVARRERGIRLFEATSPSADALPADERLRRLALVFAALLAPVPERTLQAIVMRLARAIGIEEPRRWLRELVSEDALACATVDGVRYLWPPGEAPVRRANRVRFLAPFDPVVWDRYRFEHLWEWAYRFEAYVPAAKRVRGYYALPLLWHDRVIGWANARVTPAGSLDLDLGFAEAKPRGAAFEAAVAEEAARLSAFLGLRP